MILTTLSQLRCDLRPAPWLPLTALVLTFGALFNNALGLSYGALLLGLSTMTSLLLITWGGLATTFYYTRQAIKARRLRLKPSTMQARLSVPLAALVNCMGVLIATSHELHWYIALMAVLVSYVWVGTYRCFTPYRIT